VYCVLRIAYCVLCVAYCVQRGLRVCGSAGVRAAGSAGVRVFGCSGVLGVQVSGVSCWTLPRGCPRYATRGTSREGMRRRPSTSAFSRESGRPSDVHLLSLSPTYESVCLRHLPPSVLQGKATKKKILFSPLFSPYFSLKTRMKTSDKSGFFGVDFFVVRETAAKVASVLTQLFH
jgi:hypothetical protein